MVYFILYLFLEVMISAEIAGMIGGLNTFLEVIISAFIGILILKNFHFSLLDSIKEASMGEISQEEFIKTNVGKGIGALLMIVPGFFTDIIGLLLQFGFLTMIFSKIFSFKTPTKTNGYSTSFDASQPNLNNTTYKGGKNNEIIDVEIIDDNSTTK